MSPGAKSALVGLVALTSGAFLLAVTIAPLITAMMSLAPALAATGPAGATAAAGIAATGTAIAGVVTAISGAIATTAGIGGLVMAAIVGGTVAIVAGVIAMATAISSIADGYARVAEAEQKQAEAKTAMGTKTLELVESSSKVLANLEAIATSDFSAAIRGMSSLIEKVNEFGSLQPKVTATIENLALLSVGAAKDSMTGEMIKQNNMTANKGITPLPAVP